MTKPVLSYLPPAWGGPFVWVRNDAGRLSLRKLSSLTDEQKAEVSR
jgi:hypothetical protein